MRRPILTVRRLTVVCLAALMLTPAVATAKRAMFAGAFVVAQTDVVQGDRIARVKLHCNPSTCTGKLVLAIQNATHPGFTVIGRKSFSIKRPGTSAVRVRISLAAFEQLRTVGTLKVRATAVTSLSGTQVRSVRTITLEK